MPSLRAGIVVHPFFRGLDEQYLDLLAGCAMNARFDAGDILFREGKDADRFFLIQRGTVALETHVPGRGAVSIQTVGEGQVVGWSWLFPPHHWHYDARAIELTQAIAFDGNRLRDKCDEDHDLGYDIIRRFAQIISNRLQATRLQFFDVYGVAE